MYRAAKWHSYAKGWLRSCETPFEMASQLRNGGFQGVEVLQLRNGCTGLRNGTRMPRDLFAAAKIFVEGAWRLQNHFAARGAIFAAALSLLFELLLIPKFLLSTLLIFLLILIIQKPILHKKKFRIKALKSKLKHLNQNLKH